jgi:hypothetical protein
MPARIDERARHGPRGTVNVAAQRAGPTINIDHGEVIAITGSRENDPMGLSFRHMAVVDCA